MAEDPSNLPSLSLLAAEVAAEGSAQERRGDSLDAKAGVVLGFAGVLVGLSVTDVQGAYGTSALVLAAISALFSGLAFRPRGFPTLDVLALRQSYLTADPRHTQLRLLDTRIALYQQTQDVLERKARLLAGATGTLGVAVFLAVLGATLD